MDREYGISREIIENVSHKSIFYVFDHPHSLRTGIYFPVKHFNIRCVESLLFFQTKKTASHLHYLTILRKFISQKTILETSFHYIFPYIFSIGHIGQSIINSSGFLKLFRKSDKIILHFFQSKLPKGSVVEIGDEFFVRRPHKCNRDRFYSVLLPLLLEYETPLMKM